MRTPVPAVEVLAFLGHVEVAVGGRRQTAVDVEGQRPLLQAVVVVLAGFLGHAPVEQVPADEQLGVGLRAVTVRGFAADVDLTGLRGTAARAEDVFVARRADATHSPTRHRNKSEQRLPNASFYQNPKRHHTIRDTI